MTISGLMTFMALQMNCVPNIDKAYTGKKVVATALGARVHCPVAKIYIELPLYTGYLKVLVTDQPL